MHVPRLKYSHKAGFTLLEIMISILLFSIIITTVFASYRSVFFSTGKIDASLDLYGMTGSCLNRISLDLSGIAIARVPEYAKPEFDSSPDPYRVLGDRSDLSGADFPRLRLTSRSHVPLDGSAHEGVAEIIYYVSENEESGYVLRRSDRLYPYEPPEEQADDPVLCEKLKSLVFTYYDNEGEAHDTWDSESGDVAYATPKSINILLEVGEEGSVSTVFETMVMLPVVREAME
ncbi:type II secretion system protein GspJ [Thermodesulfobacteriota bacterium]